VTTDWSRYRGQRTFPSGGSSTVYDLGMVEAEQGDDGQTRRKPTRSVGESERRRLTARSDVLDALAAAAPATTDSRSHLDAESCLLFLKAAYRKNRGDLDLEQGAVVAANQARLAALKLTRAIAHATRPRPTLTRSLAGIGPLTLGIDGIVSAPPLTNENRNALSSLRSAIDQAVHLAPFLRDQVPARAADLAAAILDVRWPSCRDPRVRRRVTRGEGRVPEQERFASQCLAHGLGAIEAAKLEAIARAEQPDKEVRDTWYESPKEAIRRWKLVFSRLRTRVEESQGDVDLPDQRVAAELLDELGIPWVRNLGTGSVSHPATIVRDPDVAVQTQHQEAEMNRMNEKIKREVEAVTIREDEDAAIAVIEPFLFARYRGGTSDRKDLARLCGVPVATLRAFVRDPQNVPRSTRGKIVAALTIPESIEMSKDDPAALPLALPEDVAARLGIPPQSDWYVSESWLNRQVDRTPDWADDICTMFGFPGALPTQRGYAIPLSAIARYVPDPED